MSLCDEILKLFQLTVKYNYCQSQIMSNNVYCLISMLDLNFSRIKWSFSSIGKVSDILGQIYYLVKENSNIFKDSIMFVHSLVEQAKNMTLVCQRSQLMFNNFLESITQENLSQNIYISIQQLFNLINQSNFSSEEKYRLQNDLR